MNTNKKEQMYAWIRLTLKAYRDKEIKIKEAISLYRSKQDKCTLMAKYNDYKERLQVLDDQLKRAQINQEMVILAGVGLKGE